MNEGLTGLEEHEGEYLMTEFSFLGKLSFNINCLVKYCLPVGLCSQWRMAVDVRCIKHKIISDQLCMSLSGEARFAVHNAYLWDPYFNHVSSSTPPISTFHFTNIVLLGNSKYASKC